MMIYARAAYALLKTGPGLFAMAVLAVWIFHSWGEWKGASSRTTEVSVLRGSIAALEQDRQDNAEIRKRDSQRVARLLKLNSDLKEVNEETMEALDRAKISKSCNACRIGAERISLLNNLTKHEHFSFRGAVK